MCYVAMEERQDCKDSSYLVIELQYLGILEAESVKGVF